MPAHKSFLPSSVSHLSSEECPKCSRMPTTVQSNFCLAVQFSTRLPGCATIPTSSPLPCSCQGRIRMITIGMNYKVLPGKEDNFERMFNNVLHSLETVTGHSKSALYKDVNDLQSYLIVSEWASEDAFAAFVRSEKFKSVVAWGQENILADRPVHTVYRGTEHAAPYTINLRTAQE